MSLEEEMAPKPEAVEYSPATQDELFAKLFLLDYELDAFALKLPEVAQRFATHRTLVEGVARAEGFRAGIVQIEEQRKIIDKQYTEIDALMNHAKWTSRMNEQHDIDKRVIAELRGVLHSIYILVSQDEPSQEPETILHTVYILASKAEEDL